MKSPISSKKFKGARLEIFGGRLFTQSKPVWVDDLGTGIYLFFYA
jgi:hypothetical protein